MVWQDDRNGFYDVYMTYVSRSFLEQDFFGEHVVDRDWHINPTDTNHHVNPDIYGTTVVWQTELGVVPSTHNVMY